MYKLSAILKRLKHLTAALWRIGGLSAITEGWHPIFFIFKPKARETQAYVKDGGVEGIV